MRLSIIIPVLNEAETLAARLAALQAIRARGVEVIVVDGGSADDSAGRATPVRRVSRFSRRPHCERVAASCVFASATEAALRMPW